MQPFNLTKLDRRQVREVISKIPYWIRFTGHCPFKLFKMKPPGNPKQYFGFLRGFFNVDEEFAQCIWAAAQWAENEVYERNKFKKLIAQAPADVLYEFGIKRSKTAYQTPETRAEFEACLDKFIRGKDKIPTPTGFGDYQKAPHKVRQVFQVPVNFQSGRDARPAAIQIRPNSHVVNYH